MYGKGRLLLQRRLAHRLAQLNLDGLLNFGQHVTI